MNQLFDSLHLIIEPDARSAVLNMAIEAMNDTDNYFVPISWSGEVIDGAWGSKYE